ncbi:hypothetical protein [Endozoicomonas sp. SCSIO W0465]|nr:hypothetical protein [Endozoicomonas sp. SCSIO W0465]
MLIGTPAGFTRCEQKDMIVFPENSRGFTVINTVIIIKPLQ